MLADAFDRRMVALIAAIVPRLIPRDLLAAASALNGITIGVMVMVGPALAGILVALTGYGWTYTIDVVLMLAMFLGLWTLPVLRPEGEIVCPGLESLVDGWRFLKRAANIRMQFLSSLFSGRIVRYRWHGRGIERAVQAYGAAILLFGVVLLLATWAPGADETHANIALIVAASVVAGGPRLGALYAGTLATFTVLWFPPPPASGRTARHRAGRRAGAPHPELPRV